MDLLAELSPEEVDTFASICHHDNHHGCRETVITIILTTIFISSIIRYLSLRCLPFPNLIRGKRVRYLIIVTKTATAHHLKHHHHDFHSHPHHCHQCNHQHWPAIFKLELQRNFQHYWLFHRYLISTFSIHHHQHQHNPHYCPYHLQWGLELSNYI